jgi:hypothetical protein
MTPQQLQEQPQIEVRAANLEAELAQMKQLMSSFHQPETESHWWLKVAGSFENDQKGQPTCSTDFALDTSVLSFCPFSFS